MRTLPFLLAGMLAACSGGEGPSAPQKLRPNFLAVVAGDAQTDTVLATLAQPVEVVVTANAVNGQISLSVAGSGAINGVPVPNQPVVFKAAEGCGAPFAGFTLTNAQGRALERWTLGTRAGTCTMEARAVDQVTGAALVFDTAHAQVEPSVATAFWLDIVPQRPYWDGTNWQLISGNPVPAGSRFFLPFYFLDRFSNGTARMPDGGASDRVAVSYDPAIVRLDSIIPAGSPSRFGFSRMNGYLYFTAASGGSTTGPVTATLSAGETRTWHPAQPITVQ